MHLSFRSLFAGIYSIFYWETKINLLCTINKFGVVRNDSTLKKTQPLNQTEPNFTFLITKQCLLVWWKWKQKTCFYRYSVFHVWVCLTESVFRLFSHLIFHPSLSSSFSFPLIDIFFYGVIPSNFTLSGDPWRSPTGPRTTLIDPLD